ncbi:hypothetical protein BJ944DRAFT_184120 [Cunninghamella echinulata]|nr:hypothetical protein BJ944DRAFT_184120 [Cunninghamella echinulata]
MSWWGTNPLDELIDKATSEYIPVGDGNLALHLEISDEIRSKKVNSKDAMRSLKRRIQHKNPNVVLAALNLTDTCVKNSGDAFVREIASREFMDELVSIIRAPTGCNIDVKNKILTIVQTWGLAAKGKPNLSYITDTYYLLQAEGYTFPPISANTDSILLETSAAPEWTDSDVCERCRTQFTMTNRKHHCRQCGRTFCQQCSSKNMPLPHLAIHEEVRVCDGCYIKLKLAKVAKKDAIPSTFGTAAAPIPAFLKHYQDSNDTGGHSTNSTTANNNTSSNNNNNEDSFDDDLKKAIELSLKEEESRKNSFGIGYTPSRQQEQPKVTTTTTSAAVTNTNEEEDDPDLAAAIAASLRDMEISNKFSSYSQPQQQRSEKNNDYNNIYRNRDDLSSIEMENIQLFSTLMERVQAASGDISRDTQINKLYTQIGTLQPKLVKCLDETNKKHRTFVELHEKLNMAVKSYDNLLEQRVSSAHLRSMDRTSIASYYNTNSNNYVNQPSSSTTTYTSPVSSALYPPIQQPASSPVYNQPPSTNYLYQQQLPPQSQPQSQPTPSSTYHHQHSISPVNNTNNQYQQLPQQQQQTMSTVPSYPPQSYDQSQQAQSTQGYTTQAPLYQQQQPTLGYHDPSNQYQAQITTTHQQFPQHQPPQQQQHQQQPQQQQQQQQQPVPEAPLIDL